MSASMTSRPACVCNYSGHCIACIADGAMCDRPGCRCGRADGSPCRGPMMPAPSRRAPAMPEPELVDDPRVCTTADGLEGALRASLRPAPTPPALLTPRERAARKFDPMAFSPTFDFVMAAAAKKPTGVKFGPGHPHEGIPDEAEAQWVSVNGDLVELSLWFGALARPGIKRAALLIDANGKHEITSDSTARQDAPLGDIEAFVYEPDNAVIRSHLLGQLAEQLGARIFSPEIAYLTSSQELHSPWLKGYRVLDNLTFDRKKLKAYLREKGIGTLEIKKRGSDIVPEQLRKELQPKGKGAATLIVTRVGDAHRVLVCESLR